MHRFGRSEYKQRAFMVAGRPAPTMRLAKTVGGGPRAGSLLELVNARMAQRYNSDEAY
jgi:hypothetical protein